MIVDRKRYLDRSINRIGNEMAKVITGVIREVLQNSLDTTVVKLYFRLVGGCCGVC